MKLTYKHIASIALSVIVITTGCKHDPPPPAGPDLSATQYPLEIAEIMVNKCATSGCHNDKSFTGAGSLRLDDWEYLFDGSSNGAVIIPYDTTNSSLLYFINPGEGVYDALSVLPTMPYEQGSLSKEEYDLIKNWIGNGAPDKNGNIPFASNAAGRQKAYMTQQRCNLLGVIDVEKNVVMRNIKIGTQSQNESPHFVKIDPNGQFAYVCFTAGNIIQKIDIATDKVVNQVDLSPFAGGNDFNIVQVSPDGKKLITSQLKDNGVLIIIDAASMAIESTIAILTKPHGIAFNQTFDTFYVTGQFGNTVYKVTKTKKVEKISNDGNPPIATPFTGSPDAHEIIMTPDYSKYFLTCENTNDVRVMDRLGDTLLKIIPVGKKPQEVVMSKSKPYLFVTCMEDDSPVTLARGSVYVINYNTLEIVKEIDGSFFQPHGISVDDRSGKIFIASRNINSDGPAPHHVSGCAGRNGYYQIYDLNTLAPLNNRRYEVTPDPYSIDMRFK